MHWVWGGMKNESGARRSGVGGWRYIAQPLAKHPYRARFGAVEIVIRCAISASGTTPE
jgi:hypothetical protein